MHEIYTTINNYIRRGSSIDAFVFISLFSIVFIIWRLNYYFIFWDEWLWAREFVNNKYTILIPYNDHFKPLFKATYYFLFDFFGTKQIYTHYILLLLHSCNGYLLYTIANRLIKNKTYSFIASLLFILSPSLSNTIFTNFSICIVANTLLFLLSISNLQKFIHSDIPKYFHISIFFIIIQSYFYSTGLVFPFIALVYYLLFTVKTISHKIVGTYIAIIITNIAIYYYFTKIKYHVPTSEISISNFPQIFEYLSYGLTYNFARNILLNNTLSSVQVAQVFSLIALCLYPIFVYTKNPKHSMKIILFLFLFYTIPFTLISIGRYQYGIQQGMESRYAYFYIIPLSIFIMFVFQKMLELIKFKYVIIILFMIIIPYLNNATKSIIELKNKRNEMYQHTTRVFQKYITEGGIAPNLKYIYPDLTTEQMKDIYIGLDK